MNIAFPFRFDTVGNSATAGRDDYVRQLIELTLFTEPGERVNRPDFGCGLLELVFSSQGTAEVVAVGAVVRAALEASLRGVVDILDVTLTFVGSTLHATVRYIDPTTGVTSDVQLERQM